MGRYQMITKETKAYLRGFYGRPPGPVDPEVQKLAIGDNTPITVRPADLLERELPRRKAELEELGIRSSPEDLVSYALFPQVALEFFARRDRKDRPKDERAALVAAVADLLGVQQEAACVTLERAAAAQPAAAPRLAEPSTVGGRELACPLAAPGSAWAAAGRRDLIAARALQRR